MNREDEIRKRLEAREAISESTAIGSLPCGVVGPPAAVVFWVNAPSDLRYLLEKAERLEREKVELSTELQHVQASLDERIREESDQRWESNRWLYDDPML